MSQFAPPTAADLTAAGTLNSTIAILSKTFDLSADGYLCKTHDLYCVLLKAAANRTTIEAACKDLARGAGSNTVRGYLNAQLDPAEIRELEQDCNRALYQRWPHWLWAQPLEIAADLHDVCYYGEYDTDDPNCWVHKAQKRAGTRHFYRCATLSIVHKQLHLTLAVVFVHPDDRARTCSQNPALRFFLMGLALILVNVWVCLRCHLGWLPDQPAQHTPLDGFTLEQMARFLTHAVESQYGVVNVIKISKL